MMAAQIEKEKLLLVEGQDEVSVFSLLLEMLGIHDIQIIDCGGNVQFKSKFPALLKTPGFADVTSYAIFQDADSDSRSALESIQYLLKKYQQPVPVNAEEFVEKNSVRVGIFILPGAGLPGMLEDLYLRTLEDSPILECVDTFVEELRGECPPTVEKATFGVPIQRLAKVRTIGTFMATAGPHTRLGHAAKDGYWNLRHPAMDPLIAFIQRL